MALILTGGGITDVRGSVSGSTFSRSKFGSTMRAKTSPNNPRTSKRGVAHGRLVTHSRAWSQTLTEAQRVAWNSWALTMPQTNVFGATSYLSGQQWYVKLNINIDLVGGTPITAPPVSASFPGITSLSLVADHSATPFYIANITWPALTGTPFLHVFSTWSISPGIFQVNNLLRDIGSLTISTSGGTASFTLDTLFNTALPDAPFYQDWAIFAMIQIIDQDTGAASPAVIAKTIIL